MKSNEYIHDNNYFKSFPDNYNNKFANYRSHETKEFENIDNNNFQKSNNSCDLNKPYNFNIFYNGVN